MWLRKLLPPAEVKLVLSAFSEIVRELEKGPHACLGADSVAQQVRDDIFRWADQIKRDVHEGKPPRVVALFLTMNVARDYLASGRFHVFPGRLSMSGAGVRSVNSYCCDELERLHQITPDEKAEILKVTREDIRAVG
jgi:hypothetical protein